METEVLDTASIDRKVADIIDSFFSSGGDLQGFKMEDQDHEQKLMIILSESIQALSLVASLEDEFNIEFDDDEIDVEFFTSKEIIAQRIEEQLKQTVSSY